MTNNFSVQSEFGQSHPGRLQNFLFMEVGHRLSAETLQKNRKYSKRSSIFLTLRPRNQRQKLRNEHNQCLLVEGSDLFDWQWYVLSYPDVALKGYNPSLHYLRYGATMRYQPSSNFDGNLYLDSYHDVAKSQNNPLVHYLLMGAKEGRSAYSLAGELIQSDKISSSQSNSASPQ